MPKPRPYNPVVDSFTRVTKQVEMPEGRVRVAAIRSLKTGGTRIILLHGSPGRAQDWSRYLIEPPIGTEALAVDRPGFGASRTNDAVTSLTDHADAVAAFMKPDDQRPAVLVGYSYGGAVAIATAVHHPYRVDGVVLIAAPIDADLEFTHWHQHLGELWPISRIISSRLRHTNRELFALEAELRRLAPRLNEMAVPVIALQGSADELVDPGNLAFIATAFSNAPHVETIELRGLPHDLPWSAPGAVRRAIEAMVQRVSSKGRKTGRVQ